MLTGKLECDIIEMIEEEIEIELEGAKTFCFFRQYRTVLNNVR